MHGAYRTWLARGNSRRWLVVGGGVLMNLALGVRHAWSVFRAPLVAEFGWAPMTATWPLILSTAIFALLMLPAGRWTERFGPRPVGVSGGLLMGCAFIGCSWAPTGQVNASAGWLWIMVTYGVLTGVATGLGYAAAVATGVQWFPDQRGRVTGLVVFGFGFAPVVFAPLANTLIRQRSVWDAFFQLGLVFAFVMVIGALFLASPPEGWRPADATGRCGRRAASARVEQRDVAWRELLQMRESYILILLYACATTAGLMVISFAQTYLDTANFDDRAAAQGLGWLHYIPIVGYNPCSGHAAQLSAAAVGWLALWSALGRIIVGYLYDHYGWRITMVLNCMTSALAMLLTPHLTASAWLLVLMYLVIGLTFGGHLALFPATTADWFGPQHVGANYGIIFLGWGLGGVIGPLIGNFGVQTLGGYQTGFYCAAVLGMLAAVLAYWVKRDTPSEPQDVGRGRHVRAADSDREERGASTTCSR
jgi:OFA family oxalate/formate antiporter-like MFS transporter